MEKSPMTEEMHSKDPRGRERRRNLIVNPGLQKRLIRDVSLVPVVALIAGVAITAVSFRLLLLDAVDAGVTLPGVYPFLGCLAAFVFLAAFVTLNMAARISNRVAGPLYRLHRAMEELAKGNTNCHVHFREKDYLEETAEVFNRLVDSLAQGASEKPPRPEAAAEEKASKTEEPAGAAK